MQRSRTSFGVAIVVALAALLLAAPATAAPPILTERYEGSDSGTFDDCGFEIAFHDEFSGRVAIRQAPGSTEAFLVHDNFRFRTTFTNTSTGDLFVAHGRALFREVSATHLEGSVYRFVAQLSGQPIVIEDMDGNVVFRDRGLIVFEAVFDTLGDGQPGGVLLEESVVHVRGPHPEYFSDFCAYATDLIG